MDNTRRVDDGKQLSKRYHLTRGGDRNGYHSFFHGSKSRTNSRKHYTIFKE